MFFNNLIIKIVKNNNKSLRNGVIIRGLSALGKARNSIPNKSLSQKDFAEDYYYINDINIAKMVTKHLSNDLPNEKSIIFESSPGTALLTRHLLESGAQRVRVFEHESHFLIGLNKLKALYPKQLQIIDKQILNLPNITYKYWEIDEQYINSFFAGIPRSDWRSLPSIKFVSVLSPRLSAKFLRFAVKQLTQFELFFSEGRTQFLVFISEKEYKYMSAKPSENMFFYRSATILYNTLFDIELLETLPYNQFGRYSNIKKTVKKTETMANLVRLTPKINLDEFESEMLLDYHCFVSLIFMKRKNWIIPYLEKWFPNCGPKLIKMQIPVFKYFGELTPQEVFNIFEYFYNTPEYKTSLFKSYANERRYATDDEVIDEEIPESTVQEI